MVALVTSEKNGPRGATPELGVFFPQVTPGVTPGMGQKSHKVQPCHGTGQMLTEHFSVS